jgi:ABC-type lipoprotein release transport system permease subunit
LFAGIATYWLSGRTLETFLLSVPIIDLTLVAGLAVGISVIAAAALILPARRAMLIDPATVLRQQ